METSPVFSLPDNSSVLRSYMRGEALPKAARSVMLASFLVYRSIPSLRTTRTTLEGERRTHTRVMLMLAELVYPMLALADVAFTPSEAPPSLPAGCSSLGDLLCRSARLGIPLRDLLRLVPVLPCSPSGLPLQAF